ncbi:type VI secretion system contractile sheath large subunit [Haliangium sp.]|uniref:type VI secretion system contractile sheath large subunit n=1 Tax=Haliangium sp. TaxID=2663208 RepID=UPI003D0A8369
MAELVNLSEGPKKILEQLVDSLGLDTEAVEVKALVRRKDVEEEGNLAFFDNDPSVGDEDRFVNCLAVLLANVDMDDLKSIRLVMKVIDALTLELDAKVQAYIHRVLRSEGFRNLETSWRSLSELVTQVTSEEVVIDFLDVTKNELSIDLEDHDSDILTSALFKKVYVAEYDRYGGKPFGNMIGLYYFDASEEDIDWLRTMSKISAASHAPFVASVSPQFFGFESFEELSVAGDLEALMSLPKYGEWNNLRHSDAAAYVGLTLPRFMLRKPWGGGGRGQWFHFEEEVRDPDDYLWGCSSVLFARNMIRAFENSGWCQHICGPRGGGLVSGLPVHIVERHGHEELQPPVEVAIPDYRELQFARCGFIPLIHCKGTADAAFFSAQSIKVPLEFEDDLDTKNADLVCNLSYTMSITRIAHYVKRMVRDYIGSSADGPYIQAMLEKWLVEYVTTAVNPDDLTLLFYPFKAMSVTVEPKPGPFGWYKCIISVLPHIQFQGMDVELRLEAALGGA